MTGPLLVVTFYFIVCHLIHSRSAASLSGKLRPESSPQTVTRCSVCGGTRAATNTLTHKSLCAGHACALPTWVLRPWNTVDKKRAALDPDEVDRLVFPAIHIKRWTSSRWAISLRTPAATLLFKLSRHGLRCAVQIPFFFFTAYPNFVICIVAFYIE